MMKTVLFVVFCIFIIVDNQIGTQETDGTPAVDCKMGPWSQWSACDSCSKLKFRSRSVETFGQFKGYSCNQPLGDRRFCKTDAVCDEKKRPECSSSEFQCDSGTCIKKRLLCNEDNDCGDFSDESNCEEMKRAPCGKMELELSELGRTAGYGVNILGSEPRSNPFNNELFNGLCNRVRDTNTLEYHRIPWNVATLSYTTVAKESFSKEIYDDTSTLVKDILEGTTTSVKVGLSFKFTQTESDSMLDEENTKDPDQATDQNMPKHSQISPKLTMNVSYVKTDQLRTLTEYSSVKHKSFMRIKGKVQLSNFRLRSRDLMLTETFLDDVSNLPVEYSKGEYFRFLEDYGTHYAMSGQSGGEYELVYILNKENLKTKHLTEKLIQDCLGINTQMEVVDGTMQTCGNMTTTEDGNNSKDALIDKVLMHVRGGTAVTAITLKKTIEKKGVMDLKAYVDWAKSLTNAPVLIHSQPQAIQTLVPLMMPNADAKRANLEKATEDYIAEYSLCKCRPCQNGGTIALVDGQCLCLCAPQFEGLACQIVKSDLLKGKRIVQEGNWNCWSNWSDCRESRRSRTRSCNTEGLSGATCKGETISSDYC